mmetsp:Transcript_59588/g.128972  ORF Transcript_59588/g.128972 Transcript_59588/m.128972 type:complete len:306 (+) Transcript_59588:68-985(+)
MKRAAVQFVFWLLAASASEGAAARLSALPGDEAGRGPGGNASEAPGAKRSANTSVETDHLHAEVQGSRAAFLHTQQFSHRLRVCNAYPDSEAIDVFQGETKITDSPMSYKSCQEFPAKLKDGEKLHFEVGSERAGSFTVSDLPRHDAVLMLVIYRHDALTAQVAFESHVFAKLVNAQIAVLDTYRGFAKGTPRIQDQTDAKTERSEELRFDSVVAVNPGVYEVVIEGPDSEIKARQELIALNRESYVVVRCGVEPPQGQEAYGQDLIIFPHSDAKALLGGAPARHPLLLPTWLGAVIIPLIAAWA